MSARAIAIACEPLRGVWQAWNRFWFEPISTMSIAVFRILYGGLILAFIALLVPDLSVWFSDRGPFTAADARRFWGTLPDYSILLWFPSSGAVLVFFVAFAAAAFCLMIGFRSRLSALLVFIGLVSISHRSPLMLHGGDTALRLMAFYLMLAPSGAALSVDRLRAVARGEAGPRAPLAPPWAQRLLQLQISLIYAMTVLLKIKGQAWSNGTALYYTSRLEEFHRFPMPAVFDSLLMVNLLTYWTLAVELALAFLVWVPALRGFVLLNGLALHAGIEYTMNIPLFAATMTASYVPFVAVEARWLWFQQSRLVRGLPHARLLVPDGCPAGAVRVLQAIDVFERITVIKCLPPTATPAAANPLMDVRLQTTDGRECMGLAACRWLAARVPLLWPALPLLFVPGADAVLRVLSWRLCRARLPAVAGEWDRVSAREPTTIVAFGSDGHFAADHREHVSLVATPCRDAPPTPHHESAPPNGNGRRTGHRPRRR